MLSFPSRSSGSAATWLALLVLSSGLLVSSTPAGAAVLCGKKNPDTGQLREGSDVHVRTACKATELQISLADLGLEPKFTVRTGNTITTNVGLSTPALCLDGEVATGGGAITSGTTGGIPSIRSSRPQPDTAGSVPTSWRVNVSNLASTGTITATAYVVCQAP